LSADLTVTDFDTELNVYLKKCTPYLKGVLYKEPNFNRLLFKNGNLCAVFTSPKKYKGIIHSIAKVGFKSVNIKTLCRVIDMQQKILTARESSQDLFFVAKSAFNNAEKFPSIKTITHRRFL
jgi:hypothetical protein